MKFTYICFSGPSIVAAVSRQARQGLLRYAHNNTLHIHVQLHFENTRFAAPARSLSCNDTNVFFFEREKSPFRLRIVADPESI